MGRPGEDVDPIDESDDGLSRRFARLVIDELLHDSEDRLRTAFAQQLEQLADVQRRTVDAVARLQSVVSAQDLQLRVIGPQVGQLVQEGMAASSRRIEQLLHEAERAQRDASAKPVADLRSHLQNVDKLLRNEFHALRGIIEDQVGAGVGRLEGGVLDEMRARLKSMHQHVVAPGPFTTAHLAAAAATSGAAPAALGARFDSPSQPAASVPDERNPTQKAPLQPPKPRFGRLRTGVPLPFVVGIVVGIVVGVAAARFLSSSASGGAGREGESVVGPAFEAPAQRLPQPQEDTVPASPPASSGVAPPETRREDAAPARRRNDAHKRSGAGHDFDPSRASDAMKPARPPGNQR